MLREQGHRGEGKEEVRQEIRKEGRWEGRREKGKEEWRREEGKVLADGGWLWGRNRNVGRDVVWG